MLTAPLQLPHRDIGGHTFPSLGIRIYSNPGQDTHWLDAQPHYCSGCMELLLDMMDRYHGLVPMDPDCEPEHPMTDGTVRIYFERKD